MGKWCVPEPEEQLNDPSHGISGSAGCRVLAGLTLPNCLGAGRGLTTALFCCRPLVLQRCQRLYWSTGGATVLIPCPCTAAFEHAFVLTLHLTRLSTPRPLCSVPYLSRLPCVCVCVRQVGYPAAQYLHQGSGPRILDALHLYCPGNNSVIQDRSPQVLLPAEA